MANSIQESINNAIDTIVNKRIGALALDKTVIGVIDSVVDSTRGLYKIKCDGGYFNAKSQSENAIYLKGMSVYIQIPQNDTTKEKLIISRADSLRQETQADVTVSAINNFSIIGTNLLQNTNNIIPTSGLGIRSYHDPKTENLNNNTTITHRARSLFGQDYYYTLIDEDTFDIYKKDASALMIEADFRTALSEEQRQQTAGVYGIGLDLKFYNTNFSIGETQGEILDYYAEQIFGDITIINNDNQYQNLTNVSIKQYVDTLENNLQDDFTQISSLQEEGGLIAAYKSYISSIMQVFSTSNNIQNIDGNWSNILDSYLVLLDDLKNISFNDKQNMWIFYQNWRDEQIASSQFNNIAFVLDSNNMTGNPYNYSNWSTQYAIFSVDMETLAGINNILFYKDGFKLNEVNCLNDNLGEGTPREDIFVKNIKIYALKPVSAENGDYRLEISSPNGLVFNSLNEGNTLDVVARVSKAYYQDLTENSSYLWFKKSKNVTTVSSTGYHQYGGIGWTYLPSKGNRQRISLIDSENLAYESVYKCVSLLDETIVLAQEFYVYNFAANAELKIQSDLGVNFSFDSGTPTLTCLIKTDNEDKEIIDGSYRYYWAIVINGQRTFLTGEQAISSGSTSITEITNVLAYNNLIKGLKFFKGEEQLVENFEEASRIYYPISNIGLENAATFECYVEKQNNNTYYDIGCAILTLTNKANSTVSGYRIVIENGDQVFQYDEYGNSPTAKKLKNPLQIKPLICHFFNPVGIEIPSGNYTLNWIVPIENSMLILNDTEKLIINPVTNLREINNTARELTFNIEEFYNENLQNNQITCQVIFGGNSIIKDTNFLFTKIGENGTNGTDMVARIFPRNIVWYYDGSWQSYSGNNTILDKEPLTLYRSNLEGADSDFMNKMAGRLTLNNGRYSNKSTNSSGTVNYPMLDIANIAENHLVTRLYLKNEEILADETKWNVAGSTKTTINDKGKYINIENSGTQLVWTENDTSARERSFSNYILRAQLKYGQNNYYAFYPLCIVNYLGTLPKTNRLTIDKQFLLKEVMYNADGRNPVYCHSQGVKINNLPKGATITWYARGGNNNTTDAHFKLLEEENGKRINAASSITTGSNINYIYILPDDDFNGASCNNRIEAIVKDSAGTVIATVIVPIYMHLNTFGLASLNAWDGNSVTIDEDGGYVMAPQIGAGEKDNNNRFTGILMGKTETRTGKGTQNQETGLFGYTHGLQSIFLDSNTGNATFGLPDGYILTSDGNTLIPTITEQDNYTEGRIELRPGDVSTIGGWRIGRRSLFYATNPTNNTVLRTLSTGNETKHEKDIGHQHSGILLAANNIYQEQGQTKTGNNPYISLKGRPLKVWNGDGTKPSDTDIDNSTGNSPLVNGDSLELQLDPQQSSIFTIYRHYVKNGSWTRTPMVGINAEGRFYSNALQDEETSLNLNYVAAFGEAVADQTYTGLYIGTTGRTFFKAFVNSSEDFNNLTPLRISGGLYQHEYDRPITLHGKYINLYANNSNDTTATTTNTQLTLSSSSFYAGNVNTSYLELPNSENKDSKLFAYHNLYIQTHNSVNGNIYIQTSTDGTDNNKRSYLNLGVNDIATLQGWTNLNGYAQNGDVNLKAQINGTDKALLTLSTNVTLQSVNGQVNIYGKAGQRAFIGISGENNYLNITSTGSHLRTKTAATDNNKYYSRLYLADGTNPDSTNSYLDAYSNLYVRANNNIYSIATGDSYDITLGNAVTTTLNIDTGSNWTGASGHPANGTSTFKIYNPKAGGFQYTIGAKPGYASGYITTLGNGYAGHSSALTAIEIDDGKTNGGLCFNWGYFPGQMFASASNTGNADYVNTSIYANRRIVSNTGLRTTKNSSTITMLNHTISKSRTDHGYTSTCDITGDNLYTLLEQLLDEVSYALNYAKWAKGAADAAQSRADAAYAVGNHSHPYASNTHTHSVGLTEYGAWTNYSGDHRHLFNYYRPSSDTTSGPR